MFARERDSSESDRFSVRVYSSDCGSSSSSGSSGAGGGAPSAGTKKADSEDGGVTGGGMIRRAAAFARGEDRRRWPNISVATCVEVTAARSRVEVVFGGADRACRRGVERDG